MTSLPLRLCHHYPTVSQVLKYFPDPNFAYPDQISIKIFQLKSFRRRTSDISIPSAVMIYNRCYNVTKSVSMTSLSPLLWLLWRQLESFESASLQASSESSELGSVTGVQRGRIRGVQRGRIRGVRITVRIRGVRIRGVCIRGVYIRRLYIRGMY